MSNGEGSKEGEFPNIVNIAGLGGRSWWKNYEANWSLVGGGDALVSDFFFSEFLGVS